MTELPLHILHLNHRKLVYLYYELCRKENPVDLDRLSIDVREMLCNLRCNIKKSQTNEERQTYIEYLIYLFKMILQTRDIDNGKGERQCTFMLIHTWYDIFPMLAVYAVKLLMGSGQNSNYIYGCWKDIRDLCAYLRERRGVNHPLIETCVEIAVVQLRIDYRNYLQKTNENISLVAKWIPREKFKWQWLYDIFVVLWFHGKLDVKQSLDVYRRKFRKIVSCMNAFLDTTERKLCNRSWSEININKMNIRTLIQQRKTLSKNNVISSDNAISIQNSYSNKNTSFPIHSFVKMVIDGSPIDYIFMQRWDNFVRYSEFPSQIIHMIPVIDMRVSMYDINQEPLFHAIGLACFICEKSLIHRRIMLATMREPVWINLSDCTDIVSMIQRVYNCITKEFPNMDEVSAVPCFQNLYDSTLSTGMWNYNKEQIVMILLQNHPTNYREEIQFIYHNSTTVKPHVIYWNLSQNMIHHLPHNIDDERTSVISGNSVNLLNHFCFMGLYEVRNMNSYKTVCNILNHERYRIAEDLFVDF